MKIGICTCHFPHNYGAMLQAYALKTFLEGYGHDVVMVDRRKVLLTVWDPKRIKRLSFKSLVLYPKYLVKWYLPEYLTRRKMERNFESFKKRYLENRSFDSEEELDAIIYGSDQIWSKYKNGYDEVWWGLRDSNTKKKIAFAASMGVLNIANEEDEKFIREALASFSAISVREKDLQEELVKRGLAPHVEVKMMMDPAFLLNENDWIQLSPKRIIKDSYLLFYDFQLDEKTTEIANYIAKEKGLRLIRLTNGVVSVKKNKDYFVTAGPLEFISLFYYADFVVSSSFHGTAFSIINKKQFYVRQYWNTERVKSLLGMVGLSNRFVENEKEVDLNDRIDYQKVNSIIQHKREEQMLFLKEALYG